jgi:hypothetical protein
LDSALLREALLREALLRVTHDLEDQCEVFGRVRG